MTSRAEDVVYLSLTDTDRLERLIDIGLDLESVPTEPMRPVIEWAINQFFESGRTVAPSREALLETWGKVIDDARVELLPEDEDADSTSWAVDSLHSHYVMHQFGVFTKVSATEMASAAVTDRLATLAAVTDELFNLTSRVQPRHSQRDALEGTARSIREFEARQSEGHRRRGIGFGLPQVDDHTFNIHPGELAVIAAPPKTGKSYLLGRIALDAWINQGKRVVLFTLENSVEMTFDRIICMHLGINSRDWQRGLCSPEEVEQVREFHESIPSLHGHLEVIQPEPDRRTMESMVRQAKMLDADALLIDQLTFVKHPNPGRKGRPEIIGELMHSLKEAISTGTQKIPTILAHQINREGAKAAKKTGFLEMEHLAEGSEVERTADWVFGLHQSADQRQVGEALLQILAARREDIKTWEMTWEPSRGLAGVIREKVLDL